MHTDKAKKATRRRQGALPGQEGVKKVKMAETDPHGPTRTKKVAVGRRQSNRGVKVATRLRAWASPWQEGVKIAKVVKKGREVFGVRR